MIRWTLHALVASALVLRADAQSGPFDVTTIIRLKRAWNDDGPADWTTKISRMWPWNTDASASQQRFIPSGTVEVHARTNALGLPLRIGATVTAAEVEDQVPECSSYGPCTDWEVNNWLLESAPFAAPPILAQRLDGDTIAVGETVRVVITARKNEAGKLPCGMCNNQVCSSVILKGIDEHFELAYDVAIVRDTDLFYGKLGQWRAQCSFLQNASAPRPGPAQARLPAARKSFTATASFASIVRFLGQTTGPYVCLEDVTRKDSQANATFEEGSVHVIVGKRISLYKFLMWHEKNKTAAITGPLEPDRHRLRLLSGLGPITFLKEFGDEDARLDGDTIAVGERVRILMTNYDRVAINFGICSDTACSVVAVDGVSKDKRMDFHTYVTADGKMRQRDSPVLNSRCITCSSRGGASKGGSNLFVVHRRSVTEMAVWMEDNPRDVVTVSLEADRDKLKLETFYSSATFIRDAVWSSRGKDSELVSPPVDGVSDVVCVSLVYLASTKTAGLNLYARSPNGTEHRLAAVRPDQANVWRFNRTVVDVSRDQVGRGWRLVVRVHLPKPDASVHLQRVGGCNHLDDEDVLIIGEAELPLFLPGYNVSWASPRQTRTPPSRWCANGGSKDAFGACVCPPGFRGPTCAEGCGPNSYGMDCGGRCSEVGEGCRGMLFCAPELPCLCAPGFKGETCDQPCDVGEYGAGCEQACPYCKEGACDPFTGQCSEENKLFFGSECGRPPSTEALTVNGRVATVDSFPWHAGVYQRHTAANQYKFTCGATLVTPRVLISAAHCFYDHNVNRKLPAERYAIALGKIRSSWEAVETGTVHKSKVSAIHMPDSYRGQVSNYMSDIALVELKDSVPQGLRIATACVDPSVTLVPDETLRVAGWGDELNALNLLEYVNMPYLPTKTCYRRASDSLIKYVTADKFCSIVMSESDQQLAKGDSGGGAVVERDGVWYLQGVVSLRQGANDYTFTNVTFADHLQWIRDTLKL